MHFINTDIYRTTFAIDGKVVESRAIMWWHIVFEMANSLLLAPNVMEPWSYPGSIQINPRPNTFFALFAPIDLFTSRLVTVGERRFYRILKLCAVVLRKDL